MEPLIGERFGRLEVRKVWRNKTDDKQGRRLFCRCVCDCGNTLDVEAYSLTSGRSKSCGCLKKASRNPLVNSKKCVVEYNAWRHMLSRCYNDKDDSYPNYGGRGITVCDRWRESFENFYEDMGPRPSVDHQIDRINNEGVYEPKNLRWATPKQQANNRRNSKVFSWHGETHTLEEWAGILNINPATFRSRFYSNMSNDEMMVRGLKRSAPRDPRKIVVEVEGTKKSLKDLSEDIGIDTTTLLRRYSDAASTDDLLKAKKERRALGSVKNQPITYDGKTMTLGEWAKYLEKDYSTIKNRYLGGLPLYVVLDKQKFNPGRNNLRGNPHVDKKFGSLFVESVGKKLIGGSLRTYALCRCDCGKTKEINLSNIVTGKTKSCGCNIGKGKTIDNYD